ncbi:hypothetical protein [Arenimonas fontis]|uniref:Peptidase M61 catalytic domain-containing protein n=1 Tax=Arenimonas fontis TaxID=2608255 RepID=A0A5B2ZE00_9GAMM|nr:hypothetical protein [Arenimonas fontis]KAA2285291.1 hypothetical protein F0415_05065 [Arenimonas fontis]
MKRFLLALILGLGLVVSAQARTEYGVEYVVRFLPAEAQADVSIRLKPGTGEVRHMRLYMPEARYPRVYGDGEVVRDGDYIDWTPPRGEPARLRYRHLIDHRRRDGGHDARITADWVIARGDDLVPRATVRATRGADSRARLRFVLPEGWTNADTPYLRSRDGKSFVIVNPERRFDRPTGWIIAGSVGTRRERVGDTEISVAGPKGDVIRRNDTLAFLYNLVPEFQRAFGEVPRKLLIVSAGDPMWRGGLSGPRSLWMHADRPLISENGTSTLTHELFHVITRIRGADGDDWIAEGLAEYYSIELLRRAGLISPDRANRAFRWMRRHGRGVTSLDTDRSRGPVTARAVQLFRELDAEIGERSGGRRDLDDLVIRLLPLREVSREDLAGEFEALTGAPSRVLDTALLR